MGVKECEILSTHSNFIIRQAFKFSFGTWNDITIEQSLMRNIKTYGSLIRGRGVSDSIRTRWVRRMSASRDRDPKLQKSQSVNPHEISQHSQSPWLLSNSCLTSTST
ncbi:hypothetical protein AVEN_220159-1 [Araneus ventricosus]|uniref:Uncharacterized protein n=1 Tax=Araneus ventricosus TaxID=182803 RepID=A0A4Y2TTJ2_ARAVE|nr:hypothetical protein AVEN_220159-1 [Araneus ventricosus]